MCKGVPRHRPARAVPPFSPGTHESHDARTPRRTVGAGLASWAAAAATSARQKRARVERCMAAVGGTGVWREGGAAVVVEPGTPSSTPGQLRMPWTAQSAGAARDAVQGPGRVGRGLGTRPQLVRPRVRAASWLAPRAPRRLRARRDGWPVFRTAGRPATTGCFTPPNRAQRAGAVQRWSLCRPGSCPARGSVQPGGRCLLPSGRGKRLHPWNAMRQHTHAARAMPTTPNHSGSTRRPMAMFLSHPAAPVRAHRSGSRALPATKMRTAASRYVRPMVKKHAMSMAQANQE